MAIPPEEVGRVWHLAEPWLAKAAALTPKIDLSDMQMMAEEGHFILWLIWIEDEGVWGACLTDIQAYYNGFKTARVMCLGGKGFARWQHLIYDLEDWARAEGCDAIEIVGRKGWGRLYPEYEHVESVFSKELGDGVIRQ